MYDMYERRLMGWLRSDVGVQHFLYNLQIGDTMFQLLCVMYRLVN